MDACGAHTWAVGPTRVCGPPELYARSYTMRPLWPFPPLHLVMEDAPGTCDMYRSRAACCKVAAHIGLGNEHNTMRDAVVSLLAGCAARPTSSPCRAIDLGANNGWISAYMLSLGAHVVSVEPQPDLARALNDTITLNCWRGRSVVHNAFACGKGASLGCMRPKPAMRGWRLGGIPKASTSRERIVPGLELTPLLTELAAANHHFDLMKLDGDGPEPKWLASIDALLSQGTLSVGAILVEGNGLKAQNVRRFQQVHNFEVYRLDLYDSRRRMRNDGWDDFSPPGTIGRLDRDGPLARDAQEKELFGVRTMRHLFRFQRNLTLRQFHQMLKPLPTKGRFPRVDLLMVHRGSNKTDTADPLLGWSPVYS